MGLAFPAGWWYWREVSEIGADGVTRVRH